MDGGAAGDEANMTRWLLHLYSIEHEETWERLRAGLAGAGAPVDGTATVRTWWARRRPTHQAVRRMM